MFESDHLISYKSAKLLPYLNPKLHAAIFFIHMTKIIWFNAFWNSDTSYLFQNPRNNFSKIMLVTCVYLWRIYCNKFIAKMTAISTPVSMHTFYIVVLQLLQSRSGLYFSYPWVWADSDWLALTNKNMVKVSIWQIHS